MIRTPNKLAYILTTFLLLLFVFLFANAQFHNGNLFDFGSDFARNANKVFSSFGHFMMMLLVSSYLTYRSHKISLYGDTQSFGLQVTVIITAALVTSVTVLTISALFLSGHSAILAIPVFFVGSLVWFAFLQTMTSLVFRFWR